MDDQSGRRGQKRHNLVALSLAGLVAAMVGLSFAAVPLYRMFCQVTGYGGTPQRVEEASDRVIDRTVRVRFDANVAPGLPWSFAPVERVIEVKLGETALTFFKASNHGKEPVTGTAGFNVSPEITGSYFKKIECFCFQEQTLAPGASIEMPVTFFVDPALADDGDTKNIAEVTLSYTFYRTDKEAGVATAQGGAKSGS